ncbi:MAG TPA: hypothetical protein VGZ93_12265 [Candidatus Methylacidiphilales bacterium]|jgi:hypothetical protein|nr:hypothetical protein [Candidatus Methylacidiphilales bacterium]
MKKHLIVLSLLFLTSGAVFGGTLTAVVADSQKVIQDPKTKVIYYLESDLRHIAALSPDGKLIWCCEVFPASAPTLVHIDSFRFDETDRRVISVGSNNGLGAWGVIDKKTGVYTFKGSD